MILQGIEEGVRLVWQHRDHSLLQLRNAIAFNVCVGVKGLDGILADDDEVQALTFNSLPKVVVDLEDFAIIDYS